MMMIEGYLSKILKVILHKYLHTYQKNQEEIVQYAQILQNKNHVTKLQRDHVCVDMGSGHLRQLENVLMSKLLILERPPRNILLGPKVSPKKDETRQGPERVFRDDTLRTKQFLNDHRKIA